MHVGYRGAQQLFDRIANAVIAGAQDASPVGYSYM
jgi:nitrogenase molybdenum-iron protein NifN